MDTDQLLSRTDVARILGVSEGTVTKLEGGGFLPRVGLSGVRVRRYRLSDVRTVMRRHRAATPDAGGFKTTEIAADSHDFQGVGPSTPAEGYAALQEFTDAANAQTAVWPVDGEVVQDAT